jgi:septal ring factor EnvC (AmiA/AmiB activator)
MPRRSRARWRPWRRKARPSRSRLIPTSTARLRCLFLAVALAVCVQAPAEAQPAAAPKSGTPAKPTPQRKQQLQGEQRRLQQQLVQLRQQVAGAEASRAEAADALRESEAAISEANRRLRELAAERRQVQQEIDTLAARSSAIGARRLEEEKSLGFVLRGQYVLARQTPLQRLLEGASPGELQRELIYLDHLARGRSRTLGELRARGEELAELQAQSEIKQLELAALAEDEERNRAELLKQQAARSRTLDRLARQLAGQQRSLQSLQRDEKRLASLIGEIEKLLAEQARRQPRETARAGRPSTGAAPAAAVDVPVDSDFAQLRGKLVLPVRGEVVARFGSPRPTEAQVDAPTWKGVFIRAAPGADVHAVAAGRVVFADWLRGFGNLLVIDHGEGFLSVYGNNESLLGDVGARVGAGDPIATVGSTGGAAEAGLYFELRFKGRPIDPLRWVQAR